jgi:hypothetical protein
MAASNPFLSLACATCTKERIRDGIAVAQVGGVKTIRARIRVSLGQQIECVVYKSDETKGHGHVNNLENSPSPLHVATMNAVTVQGLSSTELTV